MSQSNKLNSFLAIIVIVIFLPLKAQSRECSIDSDCLINESCRTKPGGGNECRTSLDTFYGQCSTDKDCPNSQSCRTKPGGGNECRISSEINSFSRPQEKDKSVEIKAPNPSQRQKGIDSLTCEAYSKNMTADQQPAVAPGPSGGLSALSAVLSGMMISNNRQQYYDSCMHRLGW